MMPITRSSTLSAQSLEVGGVDSESRYLCFGEFQLDLRREELFRGGARVRLPLKVYQVLLALLEKPGEIVTREDLRARLWPSGTFVNFDANVNTTVNKLRLLLGDTPDRPVYVETIPRIGYSFVGTVERRNDLAKTSEVLTISEPETVVARPIAETATPFSGKRKISEHVGGFLKNGWAAALILCGVLIGIGIVLITHRPL